MGDIRITWDPATGSGDFAMAGAGLDTGHDLETAVLVSLFTDGVADDGDLMPPAQRADPRGWWADGYQPADPIGSRLWQAFWRPATQDTLNWARDDVGKALQWLIDDGVALAVDVTTAWGAKGALLIGVTVTEPGGRRNQYSYVWDAER